MPTKKTGAKKPSHDRRLVTKDRFSKNVLALFVLVFAAIGGYILLSSFAAPTSPAVYLTGAPAFVAPNATFTVQVRETSGTTAVNAVEADFTYNTSLVQFVSGGISYTGSKFTYPIQSSGGSGTVNIATTLDCSSGTCPAAPTGDNLVATVTFKALTTSGAAAFNMATGTTMTDTNGTKLFTTVQSTWNTTVTVDGTAPTVSITAPTNGANIGSSTSSVSITTNAADAASGISKVEFYVDTVLKSTVSASPYSYTWPLTGVALGSHTLQAKAYDKTGNSASSSAITVNIVDNTPPSAPGNFRVTGTTISTVGLAWDASTDNVGVTGYKITRNGTLITPTPLSGTTLTYNDTGLSAATTYNYTVVAIDAANNASTASSISGATSTVTPGDLNADGHVDITDLSILASHWHMTDVGDVADINHDNVVDLSDLSLLIGHYTG